MYLNILFIYTFADGCIKEFFIPCKWGLWWKINRENFWKINLPPKILIFGWKCINKRTMVNVFLDSTMREVSKICPLCKSYDGTIEYTLFHCNHTRVTWLSFPFGVISHRVLDNGFVEWWRNIISPNNSFPKIPKEAKA